MEASVQHNRRTLLAQCVKVLCKAVSVLVIARLLTPADHGVYAMAGSVTLLLTMCRDFGLGTAAVQAPSLSAEQRHTLWWGHLALGTALAGLCVALVPVATWYYRDPAVAPVLASMSPSFVLIGIGTFARAQLARDVRFGELAVIDATATIAGTVAMLAAGVAGLGPYAFVAFLLVSEGLSAALAWFRLGWRPAAAFHLASIRPLLRTGGDVTANSVLGYLLQQFDTFVVGQAFGAHVLGLYNRAALLLALPNQHVATPLTDVAVSTLSRLGRGAAEFAGLALRNVTLIGHFTLMPAALCVALPDEVVALVLGSQWPGAAGILRWLALSAAIAAIGNFAWGINVAAGQTRRLVTFAAVALPLFAAVVLLAVPHGVTCVALAVAVFHTLALAPRLAWTLRDSGVSARSYLAALVGPAVLATLFGLAASGTAAVATGPFARLAVGIAGGSLAGAALAGVWPRLRAELRDLLAHLPGVSRVTSP